MVLIVHGNELVPKPFKIDLIHYVELCQLATTSSYCFIIACQRLRISETRTVTAIVIADSRIAWIKAVQQGRYGGVIVSFQRGKIMQLSHQLNLFSSQQSPQVQGGGYQMLWVQRIPSIWYYCPQVQSEFQDVNSSNQKYTQPGTLTTQPQKSWNQAIMEPGSESWQPGTFTRQP